MLATCGPIGYAPVAPGTWGSAVGVLLFVLIRWTGSSVLEVGAIVALFVVGVWSAGLAETRLGLVDPGPVVIDEVVGMLLTTALVPVNLTGVLVAFLLFRILDIIKPWPAARFERLHGGLGIVADDAMAGVYGNVIMRTLIYVAPTWLS